METLTLLLSLASVIISVLVLAKVNKIHELVKLPSIKKLTAEANLKPLKKSFFPNDKNARPQSQGSSSSQQRPAGQASSNGGNSSATNSGNQNRDNRDSRDNRDGRPNRENRDNRDGRDNRDSRNGGQGRDNRDSRNGRNDRFNRKDRPRPATPSEMFGNEAASHEQDSDNHTAVNTEFAPAAENTQNEIRSERPALNSVRPSLPPRGAEPVQAANTSSEPESGEESSSYNQDNEPARQIRHGRRTQMRKPVFEEEEAQNPTV